MNTVMCVVMIYDIMCYGVMSWKTDVCFVLPPERQNTLCDKLCTLCVIEHVCCMSVRFNQGFDICGV